MIDEPIMTKVVLPELIFREAQNQEQLKQLVLEYMSRYPNYTVKSIKDKMAICERKG